MGVYLWTEATERPDIDQYTLKSQVSSPISTPCGIAVSPNKDKLFLCTTTWQAKQYNITGGLIANLSAVQSSTSSNISTRGLFCKPDGSKLFSVSDNGNRTTVTMPTAFSLSSSTISTTSSSLWISSPTWWWFSPDWKYVFICACTSTKKLYKVPLTTAWDLGSATTTWMTEMSTTSAQWTYPYNVAISPTWLKMFIGTYYGSVSISQFNLSTAWDITTATYANKYMSVTERWEFTVTPDGTLFLTNANSSTTIWQYWN